VPNSKKRKLASSGCVIIKGPKWCGKSTTAEQIAKSVVYLQDPKSREQNIALAKNAPEVFFKAPRQDSSMNGRLFLLFGMLFVSK